MRTIPGRYWPALALAEWLGIAVVAPFTSVHSTLPAMLGGIFLPWLIYAAVMHEVERHPGDGLRSTLSHSMGPTLAGAAVAAFANALLLVGLHWLERDAFDQPLRMLLTFALGDFTGIVVIAPAAMIVYDDLRRGAHLGAYWRRGLVLAPALGFALTLLPGLAIPADQHWVFVALPLLAVGAVLGRRASVASLAAVALCFLFDANRRGAVWSVQEVQRVLSTAGAAAIVLGARWDWMHQQRARLSASIEELTFKTQALRDAATRLSAQKEEESRKLGLELHDEVGQDMTALATRLRLAERRAGDEDMRDELLLLQQMVASAHDHLRSVIRHLHPIALERFGLERALARGPLMEIADDAGIAYECDIRGPVHALPLNVATAVYRICQEAMTNAVRHGCGGIVHVRLEVAHRTTGCALELAITDRAGPIHLPEHSSGLGLQGIYDRAHALGASYRFNTAHGNPRHWLQLDLPRLPGQFTGDGAAGGGDAPAPGSLFFGISDSEPSKEQGAV